MKHTTTTTTTTTSDRDRDRDRDRDGATAATAFEVAVDVTDIQPGRGITVRVGSLGAARRVRVYTARPLHRGYSYAGSAMPLPDFAAATEDTPNTLVVDASTPGDRRAARFAWPSTFYDSVKSLVPPTVYAEAEYPGGRVRHFVVRRLPNPYPLRTLEYRPEFPRKRGMFQKERVDATGYVDAHAANLRIPAEIKPTGTG